MALGSTILIERRHGENKLGWKVTFQKPGNPFWSRLPIDDDLKLYYEVSLQGDIQGQVQAEYEVLRKIEPEPGYSTAFKYLEATPYRRQIFSRAQHGFVPFDEALPQTNH